MLLDVTFTLVCVYSVVMCVQGNVCDRVDVRTSVRNLEKLRNCTKIVGHLRIVFLETDPRKNPFEGYSFPELTEVTDYVLVFRVFKLRTLASLFPNLRVIRGKNLVGDYSLIIHSNDDLEEIGLYNLMYIERGGVIIQANPKLCYYDTIDWYAINASEASIWENGNCQETCKSECKGLCWDEDHCQLRTSEKCHKECLACSRPHSARHCHVCKHFISDKECIKECPKDRFINENLKSCVTEEECNSMLHGKFFTFKGKCIQDCPLSYERASKEEGNCRYCGNKCVRYCETIVVNSISSAQKLSGCTHINGSLEIRVNRESVAEELPRHLGTIRYIRDSLKIARSSAISSLGFLKSLEVIDGMKLERRAALFVYENQNLKTLWNYTEVHLKINNGTVGFHNNPQLCFSEIETLIKFTGVNYTEVDVSKFSNGDEAICSPVDMNIVMVINSTNVTLTWDESPLVDDEEIVGYTIYYTNQTITKRGVSEFVCNDKEWISFFVNTNKYIIPNLKSYTYYRLYIKAYTTKKSQSSSLQSFKTLSDDPSEIIDFKTNATSHNTIKLSWFAPLETNGVLSHYFLTIYRGDDDQELLDERNYCRQPQIHAAPVSAMTKNLTEEQCCAERRSFTMEFVFDNRMISFCTVRSHRMQSWSNPACYKNQYTVEHPGMIGNFEIQNSLSSHPAYKYEEIPPGADEYEVKDLEHFKMYSFWLTACNENETNDNTTRPKCSPVSFGFARTLKLESADDITNLTIKEIVDDSVPLTWEAPISPNSLILAYNVEHRKSDISHSQSTPECITRKDLVLNDSIYRINKLPPGKYKVRVQAISLAGNGRFSEFIHFEIHEESPNYQWVPALLSIFSILLVASAIILYFWYRKKVHIEDIRLISSVNPDYSGPVYIADEWEMERKDIQFSNLIGEGSFGQVFRGFIVSRNMPCAVKTIKDKASERHKHKFLTECSVMKNFNNAHHVIKLLGIVSQGPQPLVVMELMVGDLKTYLRRTRDSSRDVTSNEMYRMAAEIADGMAYLAAKKFVHRDLAARNCMIGDDHTVKVGDFGMARDVYENDYYRKDTVGLVPIRWMAPESINDAVSTSDSDVWSYGVVLWEIATLSEQPYQGLSNQQAMNFVLSGSTLTRPECCPDLLYEIMSSCWEWNPNHRPLFNEIVERLENCIGEDFKLVSFYHSREGRDHRLNAPERIYNAPALHLTADRATYSRYRDYDDDVNLYVEEEPEQLLPHGDQRDRSHSYDSS